MSARGLVELDGETVSTPLDSRRVGSGMPSEGSGQRGTRPPGRAVLWNSFEATDFEGPPPEAVWGCYPQRFLPWALSAIQCRASEVLHVCSGALGSDAGGVRVDLRLGARPDVVGDGTTLPFRDSSFAGVLLDPPYSLEYARELYGTAYPRPSHLLAEAARVVRPGGRVGFLHFLVPKPGSPLLTIERVWGVTQGCGYRIRAFTVLRRRDIDLFEGSSVQPPDEQGPSS